MNGHQLVMGELECYVTGNILPDTHDERYRQSIAHRLLDQKEYLKEDVTTNFEIIVKTADKTSSIRIDFLIRSGEGWGMIIRYAPGSIVTRRRSALALSRITETYQIPVVVVTNGEDAEILSGTNGDLISRGLENIPDKKTLTALVAQFGFIPVKPERADMESRILYAFEVDDKCPCDDTTCKIIPNSPKDTSNES